MVCILILVEVVFLFLFSFYFALIYICLFRLSDSCHGIIFNFRLSFVHFFFLYSEVALRCIYCLKQLRDDMNAFTLQLNK